MRVPRTILRTLLLATIATAIVVPATASASDRAVVGTDKLRDAESRLLKDINRIRTRAGRKALRHDVRTSHAARARSSDMAAKRYFGHTEPDGDDAHRILARRDIPAHEVTENIGQTYGLTLKEGSKRMAKWWYRSAPHRIQMLSRDINYIGLGIARRGNRFTYTAIFTRSPDKTRPRVVIEDAAWLPSGDGALVTIDWHGVDPRLATGAAGIRRFEVERRTPEGGWDRLDGDPRESTRSFRTDGSRDPLVRIRAVDRAGNVGPWTSVRLHIPDTRPRWL